MIGGRNSLLLPALGRDIVTRWEYNPCTDRVVRLASLMSEAGLLTEASLPPKRSLKDSIEKTLTKAATAARPGKLGKLFLVARDDVDDYYVDWHDYARAYKINPATLFTGKPHENPGKREKGLRLGCFLVAQDYEIVHVQNIGPALEALEAWPGLGVTILDILETALSSCTRVLSPGYAACWASAQYWMGEDDESGRLEEELACIVDDVQAAHKKQNPKAPPLTLQQIIDANIDILTRAQLEKDIPPKWHAGTRTPLKVLPRRLGKPKPNGTAKLVHIFQMQENWPQIAQACQDIFALKDLDRHADNGFCEGLCHDAVPYVLTMRDRDCITRIYDDAINQHLEGGEAELDVNSIFLWHDGPSMRRAAQRALNFLRVTNACENLLQLLKLKS